MTDQDGDLWEAQREALGAFIRSQRQLADLSLRQVADAADISNAYLSQVERGVHEPSVRVLRGISEALGVSMQAFLEEAGVADASGLPCTVEQAIRADESLTKDQKRALITVYRSYASQAREE